MNISLPETLTWQNEHLRLLDQRQLPQETAYLDINTLDDAWHAIQTLTVRGAPAIGVAAAYALAESMRDVASDNFVTQLKENAEYLKSARPTAVNLAWATNRLVELGTDQPSYAALVEEAEQIHAADLNICQSIGKHGATLIQPGANLLTHCNAGSLAVSRFGTATAPMYYQRNAGVPFHVYVDETRPLYQGARLTAWELEQAGIDVTLICDNMAATVMATKGVDLVIVGTDRVTANGDVVNKIGTLNLAVLCQHFGVPFYVACPSSTFDAHTPSGDQVVIEERAADEVRQQHAAQVNVYNPAFDVTPNSLVTGIITEYGIAHDNVELRKLLAG
ncbi:MAG: S-methyl-5-thioribose-1-phosphate isomerase [Pseudomonadaceae bacterium]|nr:S-methyl-5-thioribose-1-phosphate isomerase [Pseudomonadaceae bacterium]